MVKSGTEVGKARMPFDASDASKALSDFIEFELWALLGGLVAVVAYQLLTRRINTNGLLNDKSTGNLDPGRVQLLVTTLVVAAAYLADPDTLTDFSAQAGASALLGTSNIFYLIQKYRALLS
jgi:hypothetical protein